MAIHLVIPFPVLWEEFSTKRPSDGQPHDTVGRRPPFPLGVLVFGTKEAQGFLAGAPSLLTLCFASSVLAAPASAPPLGF